MVLEGAGLGELGGERGGEAHDGRGGLRQALGVAGIFLGGLVNERAAGGAGGDVGQGVRGVGGVYEIAEQHDVVAHAGEGEIVRGEGAEDGFEVVEVLGEGGVGERFLEAGGVERDLEGGVGGDG